MGKINKISIKNKTASFEYNLLDSYECGIVLYGSEVKSLYQNGASINEAYCYVNNNEVFIKNMHISELKNSTTQHEPLRERKLLLTKKEINKIATKLKNKGLTLVPTYLYNKKGLIKINISLAKGKKLWDKRDSIKSKDLERDKNRELT